MSTTSNTQVTAAASAAGKSGRRWRLPYMGFTAWIGCLILLGWLLAAVLGPILINADGSPTGEIQIFGPISAQHWLGTDYLGRDMLTRVILGARYTVCVALVSTLCASGIGITLALLASVSGRWIDACMSRGLDTLTAIPSKMFALIMVAAFGSSVWMLAITAAIIYIPGAYRIARSLAVNINAMDYVTVARTRGEGTTYIMRREILPNIIGPMLADLGLRFVYVVLLLASLSFLGLGIQPPDADWGSLVRENIGALSEGSMAVVAPALAIASLTLAVNLVIDNLPGRSARNGVK
ncbi:Dipeptide transport system permease protein DppC [Cupriavidus taiwanensis]|uniref:ABC transporter permease n=1 Tax=Cupriavidus taiwanensis TaxID=164546 RepID=UPI000E19E32E|nr:ABC transporter permease [Cupriavidus taiwanensis]SOZ16102.1 Dipeptide transport system permease protein DppC [Cupriavidus taiwanensis]SOZ29213.1 Dipeptide transport system permease protein DppC [Cupriavidus taiwanensis]SOZ46677.1 Dipeptide transport system permease protein DppC [Cupriavidus taiwanensis]SPA14967.1 Dipeptide transport system permease protein DppC [Cupriavidus taiwanensis]